MVSSRNVSDDENSSGSIYCPCCDIFFRCPRLTLCLRSLNVNTGIRYEPEESVVFTTSQPTIDDAESNDRINRSYPFGCDGKPERMKLLAELITVERVDPVPDTYDEMSAIMLATERNDRLRAGADGRRLLELCTAARSNRNIDLNKLDEEIRHQFGLCSVEVVGDGACAFRAACISGMRRSDSFHTIIRECVIDQVLHNPQYYSTVLKPGEKASEHDLSRWVDEMNDPNSYADEMANIAMADRYHMQLVIFRAGELVNIINPRDGIVEHTAFLVNVGTHYKALVPSSELEMARKLSQRLQHEL